MLLRNILLLAIVALSATGCEAIGAIFRAGIWVGVLGVLVVLGLIALVVSRTRR